MIQLIKGSVGIFVLLALFGYVFSNDVVFSLLVASGLVGGVWIFIYSILEVLQGLEESIERKD